MDNNTTTNSHPDLCSVLLDSSAQKDFMLIFSLVFPLLILPLLYGIIWYEKYGSHQVPISTIYFFESQAFLKSRTVYENDQLFYICLIVQLFGMVAMQNVIDFRSGRFSTNLFHQSAGLEFSGSPSSNQRISLGQWFSTRVPRNPWIPSIALGVPPNQGATEPLDTVNSSTGATSF